MTKKYIVPCVMEVVEPDNATQGCIRTQIGPWGFMVKRTEDTLDILNVVGVEIDFEKMPCRDRSGRTGIRRNG